MKDGRHRRGQGGAPVYREADPAEAHELWRLGRDDLFANHPSSPLLTEGLLEFTGLSVEPYDPRWRFEVQLRAASPRRIELDGGTDGLAPFERIGVVDIPIMGALSIWGLASYGGGIFVPVKDALGGERGGTYGGGRYLLDTAKGADLGAGSGPDTLVLDFNFAYNPSCAYDPRWARPPAPAGNVVSVEIPVGERFAGLSGH